MCRPGTFAASAGTVFCEACPSGHTSGGLSPTACDQCPANTFAPYPGSTVCRDCGANTFSPKGSAECSPDCRFSQSGAETFAGAPAAVYDLSPLRDAPALLSPLRDGVNQVELSLCRPLPSNSSCLQAYMPGAAPGGVAGTPPPHTYACSLPTSAEGGLTMQTEVVEMGSLLSFHSLSPTYKAKYQQGVDVILSTGDKCDQDPDTQEWSTHLHIACDLSAGIGAPSILPPDGSACALHLLWKSQHGCRVCYPSDYVQMGGECTAGVQDVTYSLPYLCFERDPPPAPKKAVPCRAQVMGALPTWGVALIVFNLSAILFTIASLSYCFISYQRAYAQYSQVVVSDAPEAQGAYEREDTGFGIDEFTPATPPASTGQPLSPGAQDGLPELPLAPTREAGALGV